MKLHHAQGQCLRCNKTWNAKNAMGLAVQHKRRTGHSVEVVMTYRSDANNPTNPRLSEDNEVAW